MMRRCRCCSAAEGFPGGCFPFAAPLTGCLPFAAPLGGGAPLRAFPARPLAAPLAPPLEAPLPPPLFGAFAALGAGRDGCLAGIADTSSTTGKPGFSVNATCLRPGAQHRLGWHPRRRRRRRASAPAATLAEPVISTAPDSDPKERPRGRTAHARADQTRRRRARTHRRDPRPTGAQR